jgi:hypothetical protein
MKLFTKADNAKLFANYSKGSDMANQNVVVKIFNPYGRGTWFIMNSDPNDPDYLWGIVDLGYGAEVGSISRSDLENYRNRFGLGFERDTSFSPINAREVFKGLQNGEFFVNGGRLLSPKQRYIAELKGLTGLRQKAIEDYIEENNLTSDEVLHIVIGLGRKQISGSDVSTAIVGKKNNSESKKLLAFAKSDKALKAEYGAFMDNVYAGGGSFRTKVNPKYILRSDIESVTVKKAGKEVTYSGTDVFNGANMLKSGGDLKSKGNYISKANVVSVKLKSGKEVKPANGYWVKKGATPISNQKFDGGGDTDEGVDLFEDYENIPPKVQAVLDKYEDAFEDGDYDGLNKAVKELNEIGYTFDFYVDGQAYDLRKIGQKGKSEFEEYKMGGKTTFAQKSSAIAKKFVGKAVEPKYQKEYGKRYDAKEAKEVGNKIAGKAKAMQVDSKAFGGLFGKAKKLMKPFDEYPNLRTKQVQLKSGEYVQVFNQSGDKLEVISLEDIGRNVKPHTISIDEVDLTTMRMGGEVSNKIAGKQKATYNKKNMKVGGSTKQGSRMKLLTEKAKEIRKSNEKWSDALKRASAMMK